MNTVFLYGRMAKDPELRYTKNNTPVCSFTIATSEGKDADGRDRAEFHNCVAWKRDAENISKFFLKGDPILLRGHLQTRSYTVGTETTGWTEEKRYVTEVIVERFEFTYGKKDSGRSAEPAPVNAFQDLAEDDDELPF